MRVIAGEFKGRRLESPDWPGLRPTSDKLRETLFNVLAPAIRGARVVDAYAGTGAVGIEALSRGAAHVTFVERHPRAVRLIETNLLRCGVDSERYAIIRAGFADAIQRLAGAPPDVIFLDPPYGELALDEALEAAGPLAGDATLVVVEHAFRAGAPAEAGGLVRTRSLRSGDSALAFYRRPTRSRGSA
ncbi:MAG TPA: 16S rRNA (guanine(966)-N(2))-methyltransferase RsmD [Vicinamibacterales bacterium]|nr:16S rRNA (guanine(966)-N(2))-methyltransferase RsmD [Vicinamibacterales bacterium]